MDNLCIVSKNSQKLIDTLTDDHKFKLKGTGPINFHLGCDFFRDEDRILCYAPRKYIKKTLNNFQCLFGSLPRKTSSPLEKGDHPELDVSALLEPDKVTEYMSLMVQLQWLISLGRFDVSSAVAALSTFRSKPRKGHLELSLIHI